jgi:hypothetical protein
MSVEKETLDALELLITSQPAPQLQQSTQDQVEKLK